MIIITYQGKSVELELEELQDILNNCGMPWYTDGDNEYPRISVIGYERDLILKGEICL